MRILSEIINSEANTPAEHAIQAAFWAGQSDMRGTVTENCIKALKSVKYGRYHLEQKKVLTSLLRGIPQINQNSLDGRGDTGHEESQEFLSWDFDI